MYIAKTSFTTKDYEVRRKQILEDDFTNQEEIDEFLEIGYIEVYVPSQKVDTSDATSEADDIVVGKTAYAKGEKLEGTFTGVVPTGTKQITENGTVDVSGFANAEVNVGGSIEGSYALINYTGITNSNIKYAIRELSDIDLSAQTTCASAFSGLGNLEKIGKVKTSSNATTLGTMFENCAKLKTIDLSEIVTTNVTSLSGMFKYCSELISLDFSTFDTNKVNDMSEICRTCTKLTSINFGNNFTLEKCTSNSKIFNMFNGCQNLDNNSLNAILGILPTYTGSSGKTLSYIGLTSAQAATCTGLSNWAAAEAAGWSTGY